MERNSNRIDARRLRAQGLSYREIGRVLHISASTARSWVLGLYGSHPQAADVQRSRYARQAAARLRREQAWQMFEKGAHVTQIARRLGVCRQTAHRWLRAAGGRP